MICRSVTNSVLNRIDLDELGRRRRRLHRRSVRDLPGSAGSLRALVSPPPATSTDQDQNDDQAASWFLWLRQAEGDLSQARPPKKVVKLRREPAIGHDGEDKCGENKGLREPSASRAPCLSRASRASGAPSGRRTEPLGEARSARRRGRCGQRRAAWAFDQRSRRRVGAREQQLVVVAAGQLSVVRRRARRSLAFHGRNQARRRRYGAGRPSAEPAAEPGAAPGGRGRPPARPRRRSPARAIPPSAARAQSRRGSGRR